MDNRLFSIKQYGNEKCRVLDLIEEQDKTRRNETILIYDKKMSTVFTFINYENGLKNIAGNIEQLREEMHKLIDEAYQDFYSAIMSGEYFNDAIAKYLNSLKQEIEAIKKEKSISREIIEVACIKLAMLRDLPYGMPISGMNKHSIYAGYLGIILLPENKKNDINLRLPKPSEIDKNIMKENDEGFLYACKSGGEIQVINSERIRKTLSQSTISELIKSQPDLSFSNAPTIIANEEFTRKVVSLSGFTPYLDIPLEDVKAFKNGIGTMSSPILEMNYPAVDNILPIYSRNGSMGINTILFCIFNGYLPVGFGSNPHPVHARIFSNQCVSTAQHDYGHALTRVLGLYNDDPETFTKYKQTYQDIFKQRIENKIDDIAFKKDLLILFFLVNELAYSPKRNNQPVSKIIESRAKPLEQADDFFKQMATEVELYGKEQVDSILNNLVLETIDFKKPLEQLGYTIKYDPEKLWESAGDIQASLLDALNGFMKRHPNVDVNPVSSLSKNI
jgi:hypothetical protein